MNHSKRNNLGYFICEMTRLYCSGVNVPHKQLLSIDLCDTPTRWDARVKYKLQTRKKKIDDMASSSSVAVRRCGSVDVAQQINRHSSSFARIRCLCKCAFLYALLWHRLSCRHVCCFFDSILPIVALPLCVRRSFCKYFHSDAQFRNDFLTKLRTDCWWATRINS